MVAGNGMGRTETKAILTQMLLDVVPGIQVDAINNYERRPIHVLRQAVGTG